MKNSEEAIERVLAGLRNANAPLGMERRILAALEDHHAAQSRSGWRRMKPSWVTPSRPVAAISLACIVLVGMFMISLILPTIHRSGHPPAPSKRSIPPAELQPPATSKIATLPATHSTTKKTAPRPQPTHESDLALDEMHTPSHPAPPMPLTEQEKLLLRIAHKGDPEELAMLNPEMRSKQEAEGNAEFHKFFEESKTGGNE